MSDKLTIKKERVLSAASKCPTAKAALQELFPEAFEPGWEIVDKLAYLSSWFSGELLICVNDDDSVGADTKWGHRAVIHLNTDKTWRLGVDQSTALKIEDGHLWRKK